jgi:protein disulfide-isomerase
VTSGVTNGVEGEWRRGLSGEVGSMRRVARRLSVLALVLACLPGVRALGSDDALWMTDFDKALDIARREKKVLLLDFSGSDWCAYSAKLEEEVFTQQAFLEYARRNLVLVRLDFPRNTKLSPELEQQNHRLARKYRTSSGFPAVILVNGEGEFLGQTGYRGIPADKYVQHLERIIERSGHGK